MMFHDRRQAGRQLAAQLKSYSRQADVLVLGLPRGGVVVAAEVARILGVPLDIVVSRKIGAPGNAEYAIGAIAADGTVYLDERTISLYGIPPAYIQQAQAETLAEAQRRQTAYRKGFPDLTLEGKTVLLVDDGIATGLTMRVAIDFVLRQRAKKIIVAAPVGAKDSVAELGKLVDQMIVAHVPEWFAAVGQFYEVFDQVTDKEVISLMRDFSSGHSSSSRHSSSD